MRIGTFVKLLMYPLAFVALTLLLALHVVWFTERGSGYVIEQVAARVPGLTFKFESGTASTGLVLVDVAFETDQLSLAAEKMRVRPDGWALLGFKIGIHEAAFEALSVHYKSGQQGAAPGQPQVPVNLEIPVLISSARASDVTIRIDAGEPVRLASVAATGSLKGETLDLVSVKIEHDLGQLEVSSLVTLNSPYEFGGRLHLVREGVSATSRFEGSTAGINLEGSIRLPDQLDISARVALADEPTFYLQVSSDHVNLADLTGQEVALRQPKLEVEGTFDQYRFEMGTGIENAAVGDVNIAGAGSGSSSEVVFETFHMQAADADISGTGQYGLAAGRLRMNLDGSLSGHQVTVTTDLVGNDLRSLTGTADIRLSDNDLTIAAGGDGRFSLDVDARQLGAVYAPLAGTLGLHGEVDLTNDGGIEAMLNVAQWTLGDNAMGQGVIRFNGSATEGALSIDWQHAVATVALSSRLSLAGGRLGGTLAEGNITAGDQRWQLVAPTSFDVIEGAVSVDDHCWREDEVRLCFSRLGTKEDEVRANAVLTGLLTPVTLQDKLELGMVYHAGEFSLTLRTDAGSVAGQDVAFENLQVELEGNLNQYALQGRVQLTTPVTGRMSVDLAGSGSSSAFVLDRLRIAGVDGELSVTGRYEFDAAQLNAAVAGKLRTHEVAGSVALSGNSIDMLAGGGELTVADNALRFNADGDGLIEFDLDGRNLAAVHQGIKGQLQAEGVLHADELQYEVSAISDHLVFDAHEVAGLELRAQGRGRQIDASLRAAYWQFGSYYLGQGEISAQGQLDDGEISLAWTHPDAQLKLSTTFTYDSGTVSGRVGAGSILVGTGQWVLRPGIEYLLSRQRLQIDDHCWVQAPARACITGTGFMQGLGSLNLALTDVPIALARLGFAPEVRVESHLNLELEGTLDATSGKALVNGSFNLDMPETIVTYYDEQELVANIGVKGQVSTNALSATLSAGSGATNVLTASVKVPDVLKFRQFTATTSFATSELGVVTAFIPQLDRAQGTLRTDVAIDAMGGEPQITLTARVSEDASVVIPAAGITLSDISMDAHTEAGVILIKLAAASGGGAVLLDGALSSPLTSRRSFDFSITGNDFQLLQRPDMSVVTSSDLRVVYSDQQQLDVSGKLDVVDGYFRLKNGGSQVRRTSSDVIVVSREAEPGLLQRLDIDVDVGLKSFMVEMYGLKAEVEGGVRLMQKPASPRRAVGNVDLVSGSFSRFGQSFDIERGRLIFTGPMNNPVVDVVSSRTINERDGVVKVSLLLSGPANNIRSSIVSSPAMSEARALSYLILGRSLDSADAEDGQGLSSAAFALGLKQAAPVTEEIRNSLGLTELTLASSGMDSTSVIAGKRISSDLYVQYNYDVFSRIGGILFNYQLTDRLSLETRSGEAKSMQLIYTMD